LPRPRTIAAALAPFVLWAAFHELDGGLGLVLRAGLEPAGVLVEAVRATAADAALALLRCGLWVVAGALAWLALGAGRARSEATSLGAALEREACTFRPLLLAPLLTLIALASVALRPRYPYAWTLPVALTQDWAPAVDVAVLAAILAARLPAPRWPAPRAREVFLLSFLGYAMLTPEWAWRWEGHPGNEPKYLRQAVALGHDLTLDAEGVSGPMEELPTTPPIEAGARAATTLMRESGRMVGAVVRGEAGREAIRATRITRQTIRGKDGGVFYVLAPGPSLILAPTLRLDRAINRARGVSGRLAASVLSWAALAALLVAAVFRLVREATDRPGLAAALALGFAAFPPFLFYFFQFYPEMTGALVLAVAFRSLALRPGEIERHPWLFGLLLATLPWLHQKFLPVWLVLVVTALVVLWRRRPPAASGRAPWRRAVGLLGPTAAGLYLFALYNFAITGSVRPDALFLAWGPGGVTTARLGQGLLGLLLDARYGILPYVPVFVLAAGGLAVGGTRAFAVVLPAAGVYYLTVASADNWAGAVCNLGRYFMPVAPLAVALVGIALALPGRANRRGVLALALMLAGWTALLAHALWEDPHAANDCARLLARSVYADGHRYVPGLFIRSWSDGAPGLSLRVLAWLLGLALLAVWRRRVERSAAAPGGAARGRSPFAVVAGTVALLMGLGLGLELAPGKRREAPAYENALPIEGDSVAFVSGAASVRGDEAVVGPGAVELLVRAPSSPGSLRVNVGGEGVLRAPGLPALLLHSTGALVDLPLAVYHVVAGREGRSVTFARAALEVDGQAVIRLRAAGSSGGVRAPSPDGSEDSAEPPEPGLR
jgi:hypothetical protein